MTDEQIIRAFKGCKYSMLECTDCPYGNHMDCERDLDKDVITLLEGQQEEIEDLKEFIYSLQHCIIKLWDIDVISISDLKAMADTFKIKTGW